MIIATGINYVTEVFSFVGRSLSAAFSWFQDLLNAIGLPWEVYSLILIGFAVTYFLVSSLFGSLRGSADSVLSEGVQAQRRIDRRAAFEHRTQTMKEVNQGFSAQISELNRRLRGR